MFTLLPLPVETWHTPMSACSIPKGTRAVLLAVLSTSIWVPTLQAATQGSVGASSNGSLEISLTLGPDSYGRQQWGILRNGRKPDAATPREG